MTIKPDDDGDGVLCHVRDSRNGREKLTKGTRQSPTSSARTCCPHPHKITKKKQRNTKKQKLFLFRTIKS